MFAKRFGNAASARPTPPRQPPYQDEISPEQHDAIRKAIDPDGSRAERRVVLGVAGW